MKVSVIAAVAENMVIGKDNDLIWDLPADMAFFKNSTKGHYVIMGRKNYLSIPERFRPLPGRPNVVATRNKEWSAEGIDVVHSVEEGIELARSKGEEECFIIGGGMIYQYALENGLADRLYITWLDKAYEGDTFFPEFDKNKWQITNETRHEADERHETGFSIITYDRLK